MSCSFWARLTCLEDPLAIQKDEQGREYVHVYRYVASTEYNIYAYKACLLYTSDAADE